MKKWIVAVSVAGVSFALAGCGNSNDVDLTTPSVVPATQSFGSVQDLAEAITDSGYPCTASQTDSNPKATTAECTLLDGTNINFTVWKSTSLASDGIVASVNYYETTGNIIHKMTYFVAGPTNWLINFGAARDTALNSMRHFEGSQLRSTGS